MRRSLFLGAFALAVLAAPAQDPVKLDPKHYKVEFENERVRVLRVRHDPHDLAPLHTHPAGVVVWLTDAHERLTSADGKTQESHANAGQVSWSPGATHTVENLSDAPFEAVVVELKAQPAIKKPTGQEVGGQDFVRGNVTLLTPTEGVDFTSYLDQELAEVKRNWHALMLESAREGEKGKVVLQFHILRDGNLPPQEPVVVMSSRKDPLDRAAASAIRASSPFKALPDDFRGPSIELRVIFLYDLPMK